MREPNLLMPAAAAAVAIAFLLPGRRGPRRLGRRRTFLSSYRLPGLLKPNQVSPKTRRLHRAAAAAASAGGLLLIGIPWGFLLAPITFLGIPIVLSRLEPAAIRQRRARITAELPLAVDLLAACLRAGRPPQSAIGLVATALGGPLADLFKQVEHHLNLGADPIEAWSCLLAEPACASFARTTQRALRSGAPLAKTLERQADDTRQARRWTAEEQARAVESRSVVPLGLCFLPAFVVLGIVPTIASSLTGILDLFT